MAKLSVVVPIFNVEAYLEQALASVAQQTLRDLEVIMVDDGSTDGSAAIAKSFVAKDPRFQLLQQENQGQGPARNLGVRHATGDYLAFLDADDLVPRNAYNLLVGSLEATGSDLAAGGVRRFSSGWISPTVVHADAYRKTVPHTSVSGHPDLLRDCTVWNKVYRRSFWNSAGLEFWAARYEDIPACIRAYVLARSVDIRHEIVYYWRAREAGEQLSRNQRSRELANVEGRIAACMEANRIISRHAPALKPAFDRRVLDNDLSILIRTLEFVSEPEQKRLLELGADYLRTVDDSVFQHANAMARLRYHLLREGRHADLLEIMRYSRRGDAANARLVRLGRKWYVGYPYLGDHSRAIPLHLYDASREMTLEVRLDEVRWHAGKLRIEGYAYIRRLDAPREQDVRIDVLLRNTLLKRTLRLKVKRIKRPDVTARSNQTAACYDWSGFMVEINPARLSNFGTWRAVSWELRVRVQGHGVRREGSVRSMVPGSATWPEARWLADGIRLQPAPEHDGRFVIRAARPGAVVTACHAESDRLEIQGWSAVPLRSGAAIVVSLQQGGGKAARVPVAVTDVAFGRHGFRAAIPVTALLPAPGVAQTEAGDQGPLDSGGQPVAAVADEIHRDFDLDPGTGSHIRLAGEPAVTGHRLALDDQEISTYPTPFGNLSAVQRKCRLVIREMSWAGDRLTVRGDFLGAEPKPDAIMLRSNGFGYQHMVPLHWQDNAFLAHLSPGAMPGHAGGLPLASGRWELLAQTAAGETRVVADRRLLTQLPAPRQAGTHEVSVGAYRGDALQIRVRRSFADSGRYAQRKLQEWYQSNSADRIEDVVLFDSHGGKQYSCNPRAIYEELRRRDTGLECVWLTRDGQFTVPDGGRVVLRDSREHYELAARARFVVSNMLQQEWYRRAAGQLYLQTWHGTPLKRICLDVERPQFASGMAYHDRVRQDVANWNALLSPNTFSTPIFRRALGFDGEILEYGYPRNDLLSNPDSAGRAASIRRRLGLSADQRIMLYAPTWRDDATTRAAGYGFPHHLDFGALAEALGPDHVTLVRAHQMMGEALVTGVADSRVIDVTIYPDMADLLLITDVLITDYSSVMFDFAVTGRPMLFFTYDLERYRDRLRGFYFDFEAEAPGPLLCTSDEVIDALRNLTGIRHSYRAAYDSFAEKFCSLEDGKAAVRAVDWLLSHWR